MFIAVMVARQMLGALATHDWLVISGPWTVGSMWLDLCWVKSSITLHRKSATCEGLWHIVLSVLRI
jgi:hypothetical protein